MRRGLSLSIHVSTSIQGHISHFRTTRARPIPIEMLTNMTVHNPSRWIVDNIQRMHGGVGGHGNDVAGKQDGVGIARGRGEAISLLAVDTLHKHPVA